MRYKVEIIGIGASLTDDPNEILDLLSLHIDADENVQILICIGDHKEPDDKDNN